MKTYLFTPPISPLVTYSQISAKRRADAMINIVISPFVLNIPNLRMVGSGNDLTGKLALMPPQQVGIQK